jgi:hypothetical protein
MYEQKYNIYKFKYLCLKLQNGGYNPLRTNSMVLNEMSKKLCDADNWKMFYDSQLACKEQFSTKIDKKLENDYALSINFTAAAIAVINCTPANREKGSVDCKDTREEKVLDKAKGLGEASQENLRQIKSKVQDELTNVRKMNKCTADETLQLVASMFLAILHNSTKSGNTSIFIKNLESIINHKISNCKKVSKDKTISSENKEDIIKYYMNVINQINSNLESISTFLTNDSNKIQLITNSEYTTEKSVLDATTDIITITRTYNDYFKNNLEHLKYISDYQIMNVKNEKTFTPQTFNLPTEGIEKVKGTGKQREIIEPLKINTNTTKVITI